MKTILDEIAEKTRRRIEEKKKEVPLEALKEKIASQTYRSSPICLKKVWRPKDYLLFVK